MRDRIITIINNCTTETFDRKTVDDAVSIYLGRGSTDAERFLVETKKYEPVQAMKLVASIEVQNNKINKQSVLVRSIFLIIVFAILVASILTYSYIMAFFCLLFTILGLIAVVRAITRLSKGQKQKYLPGKSFEKFTNQ